MNQPLAIGSGLPPFSGLSGTDGRQHSSDEFAGSKVVVVVFSCNHCPYVQAYEDRMMEFTRNYGPRGVQLVAINANDTKNYPEDTFEHMVRRARDRKFNFPYLRDEDQRVAESFGASHTPEFFAFARAGEGGAFGLVYRGRMDDNYQDATSVQRPYLREAVDAVLAGAPVREAETHSIGCTIKWKV